MAKASKDVFTKQSKCQFIPMLPSILEPSRLVRNLPPNKQLNKNLLILETSRLLNSSSD